MRETMKIENDNLIDISILLGSSKIEQRYIQTSENSIEYQTRKFTYDRDGNLIHTSEWESLSSLNNVVPDIMEMALGKDYHEKKSWLSKLSSIWGKS